MSYWLGKSIDVPHPPTDAAARGDLRGPADDDGPKTIVDLAEPLSRSWYSIEALFEGEAVHNPRLHLVDESGSPGPPCFLDRIAGTARHATLVYVATQRTAISIVASERSGQFRVSRLRVRRVTRLEIVLKLVPRVYRIAARDPAGLLRRVPSYLSRLRRQGFAQLAGSIGREITADYEKWLARNDYDPRRHEDAVRVAIAALPAHPLISIVTPTYNTEPALLERFIASVRAQAYETWELCIADDASTLPSVREALVRHAAADARIRLVLRATNGHISAASNSALALATGDIVTLADHDDELHPLALYHIAKAANANPGWRILFSDEDKIDRRGRRFAPYFKGDFNRDLFYGHNMMTHLVAYRAQDMRLVGGFTQGLEGSQDYDLALRILELVEDEGRQIVHIPHVLYHWRVIAGSLARGGEQKSYAHERARLAINAHLARIGSRATCVPGISFSHRVVYPADTDVLFSIVICTRDRVDLLRTCVESIFASSEDTNFEVVIVDNGSVEPATAAYLADLTTARANVSVVRDDGDFNFSRLNNRGVDAASGDYLCLLNNDTEIIARDWIFKLRMHLGRREVGAVGAKLLYRDGTIQHAGIVMGLGGLAGHVYSGDPADTTRNAVKAQLTQQVMAVTGACLATRRDTWRLLGGLDDQVLKVAYNDVDYCLKAWKAGLVVIYEPGVVLFHDESRSRGSDEVPENIGRFRREQEALKARWGEWTFEDRFYNPNLDYGRADFPLARQPRVSIV